MTLHIQDPRSKAGDYVVDALVGACEGAIEGAGAFAFVSSGGVRLFLKDNSFKTLLGSGTFDLICGVDAITDVKAVQAIQNIQLEFPTLRARAFISPAPSSIFHPKVTWFRNKSGGVLVTGSGNLTAGGLRWNVEAFTVNNIRKTELESIKSTWDHFLNENAKNLFDLDDARVVARLERNAMARTKALQAIDKVELNVVTAALNDEDVIPLVEDRTEVLVAEIPKSGTRWNQANFDQETFLEFFGASKSVQRVAYLFNVMPDGSVAEQEVRPAVAVKSQNYRFELAAAAGITYPDNGRPIGVFVRIATRTFLYSIEMPNDQANQALAGLLARRIPAPGRNVRRAVFSADEVRQVWPNSPLWQRLSI